MGLYDGVDDGAGGAEAGRGGGLAGAEDVERGAGRLAGGVRGGEGAGCEEEGGEGLHCGGLVWDVGVFVGEVGWWAGVGNRLEGRGGR